MHRTRGAYGRRQCAARKRAKIRGARPLSGELWYNVRRNMKQEERSTHWQSEIARSGNLAGEANLDCLRGGMETMELEHNGKKIIGAVAQMPFANGGNVFCKLIPLFDHTQREPVQLDAADFPNDGQIWWRLSQNTNPKTIVPGMMMETTLEPAQESSPEKSIYQARFISREEPIDASAGAEIFRLPKESERSLMRLRAPGATLTLPHMPSRMIFLDIGNFIYGPFLASAEPCEDAIPLAKTTLRPFFASSGKHEIGKIARAAFSGKYYTLQCDIDVALEEKPTQLASLTARIKYEFIPPGEAAKILRTLNSDWEKWDWEQLSAKFSRMAAAVKTFARGDRQQLKELVKRLESSQETAPFAAELTAAAASVKRLGEEEEAALRDLATALMNCGLLTDERLESAKKEYFESYLEAEKEYIKKETAALAADRDAAAERLSELEAQIKREKERRRDAQKADEQRLRQSLDKIREKAEKEIEEQRKAAEAATAAAAAALDAKAKHIDSALLEIRERTGKNAADILAIFPFLERLAEPKQQPRQMPPPQQPQQPQSAAQRAIRPAPFKIPDSLAIPSQAAKTATSQTAFLQRLRDYAWSQGLSYDLDDLRRFHTSVLCEDLTILEGPSGVGKSSLARIYGDVLAGAKGAWPRNGTHIVNVSPSWMERADLLGYVNTVTAEFTPSETGLYQYLVLASADYARHGAQSAIYPVCLDEMNLAQVEHYFSDFMQIMELPQDRRILRCFSKDAVAMDAVFREYAEIPLPPSVRFIGTVNFDETTRRLSSRLLDRANLVFLRDNGKCRVTEPGAARDSAGAGVSFATYESWKRLAPLPQQAEKILDALSAPLAALGMAASPRVRSAIARYIATSAPLLANRRKPEAIALDEQLAQRVLSKLRSITSIAQRKALGAIEEIVDSFRDDAYSPSRDAIARLRSKEHFFGYES